MKKADNKRIAKNTLLLYVRSLFVLALSLYTSRLVYLALGQSDFGLYNVIAGVIVVFSYVKNSLSAATVRFFTYELGKEEGGRAREVYSVAMYIHICLAIIVFVLFETVGLWVVNNVLNIEEGRLFAANVIYQISVLSAILSLVQVPYTTVVIANEKMGVYAYLGILTAVLTFGAALYLTYAKQDKLVVYGVLQLVISIVGIVLVRVYCHRKHGDVVGVKIAYDKEIGKEMLGYTGWSLLGSTVAMSRLSGVTLLINVFFGTAVNAANAIAYKINHAVMVFVDNFLTASKPQITKLYASGEVEETIKLVTRVSKFSFYLLLLLSIPIIVETEAILKIWLGEDIPDYAVTFTRLVLVNSMIETFALTNSTAIQATGVIRLYQIAISSIFMLIFPLAYVAFKYCGLPPYTALAINLAVSIFGFFVRVHIWSGIIRTSVGEYKLVFLKCLCVAVVSMSLCFALVYYLEDHLHYVVRAIVCFIIGLSVIVVGLSRVERSFILNYIKKFADGRSKA